MAGYLANSQGGALVPSSAVTVENASGGVIATGTTDASGKFTLKLDPGVYNVSFKKEGYAASRIEGLRVTGGTNAPLNAIQRNAFATTLPVNAPKLDVKYLVGADAKAFGNDPATAAQFAASAGVPVQVTATAADPANSPNLIYTAVGGVPGSGVFGARALFTNDPKNTTVTTTATLAGNTLRGVRGPTELYVVVYDSNENRTERRIPIVITDDKPNDVALTSIQDPKALAITLSQKIGYYSPIRPTGAPAEQSTLTVDLTWNYAGGVQGNPLGVRVWTSDDGNTFRLLKTVQGSARSIKDGSASLEVGKKVYYQLEAFNSTASIRSDVFSTTPLDSFTLSDLTPADGSKDVSRTPTISWNVSKKVGDYRQFYVMVNDYPQQSANCFWGNVLCTLDKKDNLFSDDGSTAALKNTGNTYSVEFNANGKALLDKLESRHGYTLDVSAAAFSKSGDAVSIAHDYWSIFYALDTCNFGGPVCEGQVSNFTTGDN
ncbi:carboxypeptidase-like regulatory domain-containing protein [Deinococcus apachensis]|uniref:carboxypeptidase-like regulatory domain-containing protein n=1 Tax=Deinococcus apachensis TaxID=309886 RepID=UPI00037F2B52|nr:carboxypeptidase-like regulatory domain-containing protein [Deinococcus apachensis]